jgi:CspA family cold shock protein
MLGTAAGTVSSFDDAKGWGYVRTDDGAEHFFHCTAIADGTRTIAAHTPVEFELVAGHRGQVEARAVRPR